MNILKTLDEIDALEREATEGTWKATKSGYVKVGGLNGNGDILGGDYDGDGSFIRGQDAALIVALRNNWKEVSAELRKMICENGWLVHDKSYMDEEIKGLRAAVEEFKGMDVAEGGTGGPSRVMGQTIAANDVWRSKRDEIARRHGV